jgi:hypothetical protein
MVHKDETTFANLIERRMGDLTINQVELERRSGISDTTWAGWRAGRLPAIRPLFPLIATTLEVTVETVVSVIAADRLARSITRIDTVEQTKAWIDQQAPATGEGV